MKTLLAILVFFIVLSITSYAQLQGSYTIGGNDADYESLADAVIGLNANGIAASVIFNIDTGLYYEQVSLEAIAGVSEENTITFQSSNGVASDVVISFDGTRWANYIFQLDGTDNVTFNNLTFKAASTSYADILVLTNNTDNIKVSNCVFNGSDSEGNIINGVSEINDLSIENCIFNNAINSLNIQANGVGLQISGNTFINQGNSSILLYNQDNILISKNIIRNSLEDQFGIIVTSCHLGLLIEKNDIVLSKGGIGITLRSYNGSIEERGWLVNNFVSIKNGDGINFSANDYLEAYFNSVLVWGSDASKEPFTVERSNQAVTAKNNIFANEAGGYALWVRNANSLSALDYNDYYSTGNNIAYLDGKVAPLKDWQILSGLDSNSISAPPIFLSDTTLQIKQAQLNGAGIAIEGIEEDINSVLRGNPPDIGAAEFEPTADNNNAALTALIYPQAPFKSDNYDISVRLLNSGSVALQSDSIYWQVNGELQAPFVWLGNLPFGEDTLISLGKYAFEEITAYNIKVWSSSPNGQQDISTLDDTLSVGNLYTTIGGDYVLGDTLSHFTSFNQLAQVLNFGGIDRGAIINILPNTYNEQTKLIDILKTSPSHQLTFQSSSGIASDVIISFDGTYSANYIFQLDGTGYKYRGLIVNNFVSVKEGDGIYLNYINYLDTYYNSVLLWGSDVSKASFVVRNSIAFNVKNNIFSNEVGGYVFLLSSSLSDSKLDYNAYFTTGDKTAIIGGNEVATLEDWQMLYGLDSNSISVPPIFSSDTTVQINQSLLNETGIVIDGIEEDINGELRGNPPDIGAAEFEPSAQNNNAALTTLIYPQAPFEPDNYDISVRLLNRGSAVLQSDSIYWQINDELQAPLAWFGNLSFGEDTLINLGKYEFEEITAYDIKVWSSSPNGVQDISTFDDTLTINNVYTTIGGDFILGDTLSDFTNFKQLEQVLNFGGIDNDVTINVLPGTYTEQTKLTDILKTSPTHQLTFQSSSGITSDVVISFNATISTNYIFQLDGTDNINFTNLTFRPIGYPYSDILVLTNKTEHINVSSCVFQGSSDYGRFIYGSEVINNLKVENCVFNNGSMGLYLNAKGAGLQIVGNTFINQDNKSIYLNDQDSILISKNVIRNNLEATNGIQVTNCDLGLMVEKNDIVLSKGGIGVNIYYYNGSISERGLIVNNFVSVKNGGGIYIYDTDYLEVYFNSVLVWGSDVSREPFTVEQSNQAVTAKNNIFANEAGGYAFSIYSISNISALDYNAYYTTGDNIGYLDAKVPTLEDWQMLSGLDSTSISIPPFFLSPDDLHTSLAGLKKGISIEGIGEDIDGDIRDNVLPFIGADEASAFISDASISGLVAPVIPFSAGLNEVKIDMTNNLQTALNAAVFQ